MEEENKKQDGFDVNQGHGNHIDCLSDTENAAEFLSTWLAATIEKGNKAFATPEPVDCDFGDDSPKREKIFYVSRDEPLHLMVLIGADEVNKRNVVVSGYPEFDGAEVAVKLTDIHEWAAGVEATLEGEVLGEAARQIAFFDTRYAMNKGRYEIGKTYKFRLSAFAYRADVLPEKDREFRFEGDKAVEHRKRMGDEQKYDKDGNPEPVVFRMEEMVAYLPRWNNYPDDAEFQSPVFGGPRSISAFGTSFWSLDIAIAREDEEVIVPLIAKKSLFQNPPKAHDPVRGILWLQGYCQDPVPVEANSNERKEQDG